MNYSSQEAAVIVANTEPKIGSERRILRKDGELSLSFDWDWDNDAEPMYLVHDTNGIQATVYKLEVAYLVYDYYLQRM